MSRKNFNKLSDWEKVYQLPIHADRVGCYAWSKNGTMALMFNDTDFVDTHKIIASINGTEKHTIKGISKDGCDFYQDNEYIFCVRGWGNLIGTGAMNLSEEEAVKIQDGFADHILKSLTVA